MYIATYLCVDLQFVLTGEVECSLELPVVACPSPQTRKKQYSCKRWNGKWKRFSTSETYYV